LFERVNGISTAFFPGVAAQLTRHGGFEGFESTDGKIFNYANGRCVPGIWQIPVSGGEETLILDHHGAGYWLSASLFRKQRQKPTDFGVGFGIGIGNVDP
jgi:hypothetical protein